MLDLYILWLNCTDEILSPHRPSNRRKSTIHSPNVSKRAIQQSVENPLSKELLAGKFLPGSTIEVDARNGEIVFA